MEANLEQREDGKWVATCPYDDQTFTADTREDALTEEGVYRSENFIDSEENIGRRTDAEDRKKNLLKNWKREQEKVTN